MTTQIKLSHNKVALVDDEYAWLSQYRWRVQKSKELGFIAVRNTYPEISDELVYMHRQIMSPEENVHIRHRNGNGLDNRKENLERVYIGTKYQNRPVKPEESSKYKGVTWYTKGQKWRACIRVNGRSKHLGYFLSEEEAAEAYDEKAREVHGKSAVLNFPQTGEMKVKVEDR